MEPWEQNLQIQRDIRQAQTAAATAAMSRQMAAQGAAAAHQANLTKDLIFETQIVGFTEAEKQAARVDRGLDLDPFEQRSRSPAEQQRVRDKRRREIQARKEEQWVSFLAQEQARQRQEAKDGRRLLAFFLVGVGCLSGVWFKMVHKHKQLELDIKAAEQRHHAKERLDDEAAQQRRAAAVEEAKQQIAGKKAAVMDAAQERAAFFWLKKATNGEAGAQLEVGLRYLSGKGVLVDTNLAMHWLKAAAAQGDSKAKAELIKLGIQ